MKKRFLMLTMLLFVLAMSTNVVWGTNFSGMTDEQAETMAFWARLIAQPAMTTGGRGKVFVSEDDHEYSPEAEDYQVSHYADGWSDVYVQTSFIDGDVHFRTYAKADPGSYFKGWSFTDGSTDLGDYDKATNFGVQMTPSSTKGHKSILEKNLYAAFETIKLVSYTISGSNTTANGTCTQIVTFRAECPDGWALSSIDDHFHFKRPVVTKKDGTNGNWSVGDEEWIGMGAGQNFFANGEYATLTVPVTFTAPDGNPGEYAATLTLETYAGVKMKVYLYARTIGSSDKDIALYDGKTFKKNIDFSELASEDINGYTTPIVKLNKNIINQAITIDKSLTLDLNGYNMQYLAGTALTVNASDAEVTLAYGPYGGQIQGWTQPAVQVLAGKLVLNGGTIMCGNNYAVAVASGAELEQNGATIGGKIAAIASQGKVTTTDGYMKGLVGSTGANAELIINGGTFDNTAETVSEVIFTAGVAIEVGGGTAQIKKGTITGGTYGVKTSGGSATIGKLAAVRGNTKALNGASGALTVNNGKFADPANLYDGTIAFNAGYFQTVTGPIALGKHVWRNTAGAEYREGYVFFVGDQEAAQASNVSVCRIGQASYSSLEDALAYSNNNPSQGVVIIMENDYTLKAGYYTLPANATLIVPMSDDQQVANPIVPRETSGKPMPVSFRKLIFDNGVNMTVYGTFELTCTQYGKGETMGIPGGNFGQLIMKPGSHMTLSSGGELRAWGFVSGDGSKDAAGNYLSGEIDARRGSIVREMFQMGDWKGGDISFTIAMDPMIEGQPCYRDMTHLFPVYMYFIQNVESPVKYHPGSSLVCATSVNVVDGTNAYANDIKVVGKNGEDAMFLMDEMADAENTWVRKWYDAKKDQQVYEVNSGAQLGSVVIELGDIPAAMVGGTGSMKLELDSRKYVLPLTSNFKIHLLSGNMQFTQSTSCLPGMEVEIDKESEISIINQDRDGYVEGALYLYDADQWSFYNTKLKGYVGNSGKFGAIVRYSPTWDLGTAGETKSPDVRDISSPDAIGDAILNIHGTFRMGENCAVYTTWSKGTGVPDMLFPAVSGGTGGARIISSNEDAGTFIFDADAPAAYQGMIFNGNKVVGFNPDVLVNYDPNDYGLDTEDFQYPIQIVTFLKQNQVESYNNCVNDYKNCIAAAEEAGEEPECEPCTSPFSRVYGFEVCTSAKLTNGDGTMEETQGILAGTSYCYMNGKWTTMQVVEESDCFMKDQHGAFYAKPSEYVEVVATVDGSGNVVGNDDHTFSDAAGAGRLFILTADELGNCDEWWEVEKRDNLYHCIHPNNDTYYYWDDTEGRWMEQRFTITWKNYDGTEIKSYIDGGDGNPEEVEYSVTYGTQAEYLGELPTRAADIDYTYNFTGWSPALGKVTSDVTYTATYEANPRKYTIIFENEGGDEIERQFLTHNEYPVCENIPTRTGFTLEWEPAIAAVVGDATYRATWLENPPTEYQITFVDYDGDIENHLLWQGNVTVGTVPTPPVNPSGKPETDEYTYVFDHWSPALEAVSATSVKTYTAVYREVAKAYTVRFYQENGTTQIGEAQSLAYGEMPVAPTPTKQNPEDGFTYTYVWQNKADASKALETVKADADYKAVFTGTPNKYTVTLRSNPSEACTFAGAGLYDYGSSITISQTPKTNYTFTKWTDEDGNEVNTLPTTVNGDITLIANFTFEGTGYTITWNNWDGTQLASGSQKENSATTYVGATPTREASETTTYTFYGWTAASNSQTYKNGLTPKATAAETYTASFNESARQYNIVWMNEAGTVNLELDYDQPYGAAIAYNSATPTKTATEQYTYTFDGWSAEVGGDVVELPETVEGDTTFYAHFISTPIVSGYNLEIGVNDKKTLTEATTKDNLIITSNGVTSGQLINANNLNLNGEAIFRLEKTFNAGEWYAVAVPWTVNPSNGIYVGSSPLSLGSQIYVIEFDANAYAGGSTNTFDYWTFLHETGADMVPGKLYMIYLASGQSQLDFHKKAGADILTTQTAVSTTGGDGVRANWNAIANPALYHANLSTGASLVQKYNGNDSYIVGSTSGMIVGEPMFVQVESASTMDATPVGGASPAPYRRAPKTEDDTKFVVELTQNGQLADRMIVQTAEEKENCYVIGQDLAKFGVSSKVAQMWVNRYDAKLCANTIAWNGERAEYPLNISAPAAGEYTLNAEQKSGDADLYLTYNGEAIWNLSDGAYVLNLNKGTDINYGLRVSARVPQVVTGVDEAIVDAQGDTRKVLINNQVFIIRGDRVYSIDGRLIK